MAAPSTVHGTYLRLGKRLTDVYLPSRERNLVLECWAIYLAQCPVPLVQSTLLYSSQSLLGSCDGKAGPQFRAEHSSFCVHSFISAFPLDVYPVCSLPLLCGCRVEWHDFGSFQNWKRNKQKKRLKACGLQVAKFSVYLDVSCEPTMLKNISEHFIGALI